MGILFVRERIKKDSPSYRIVAVSGAQINFMEKKLHAHELRQIALATNTTVHVLSPGEGVVDDDDD